MLRGFVATAVVFLACQVSFAEDGAAVQPEKSKRTEFERHDLIEVLIDQPTGVSEACPTRFTRITAEVTEIRPNGNLVIEGHSEAKSHDAVWERSLTGEVRPESIAADRTVHSNDISERRIKIRKKPFVADDAADAPAPVGNVQPNPSNMPRPHARLTPAAGLAKHTKAVQQASAEENAGAGRRELHTALQKKQGELAQLQDEVRQLQRESGEREQILVHLQLVEISLTKLRRMGTDFGTAEHKGAGQLEALLQNPEKFGSSGDANSLVGFVDWLTENNVARTLSRPSMVMLEGRPGSFMVGGEIPVPVGEGNTAVEYKPFGTQVDILPVALGNNRVRLELRVRLSEINYANSLPIGDSKLPGLTVRQCDTAVETLFGQSAIVNGTSEISQHTVRVSGSKTQDEINESLIVMIVTPERADALVAQETGAVDKKAK